MKFRYANNVIYGVVEKKLFNVLYAKMFITWLVDLTVDTREAEINGNVIYANK